MQISKSGLGEFKKLYAERFKENLSEADALQKAQNLLQLWKAIQGDPLERKVERRIVEGLQTNKQK